MSDRIGDFPVLFRTLDRSRRWQALGVIAVATAILTACGTEPLDDVRLRGSLDRASVGMNEAVTLTLVVTNGSSQTIRGISADSYGICFRPYRVVDSAAREVQVYEGLCALMMQALIGPRFIDLGPGASITITDQWKPAESVFDGAPLSPGVYSVIPIYQTEEKTLVGQPLRVTVR